MSEKIDGGAATDVDLGVIVLTGMPGAGKTTIGTFFPA